MRVLPTAANGYIGMRLLPPLLEAGHEVHWLLRSRGRFAVAQDPERGVHIHQADLLEPLAEADAPRCAACSTGWWAAPACDADGDARLRQTATFRPPGPAGRAYWWLVTPLHALVSGGLPHGLAGRRRRTH